MNLPQKPYEGPIYYIVHAPKKFALPFFEDKDKKIMDANRKKIIDALKNAATKGIPVIYEPGAERDTAEEILDSLEKRPRVIWASGQEVAKVSSLRALMARENVVPKKIFSMGIYRNICVITGAEFMRAAFPKAEIHIIGGASTFFRGGPGRREAYRAQANRYKIKLTKRLKPRHFA
ncbi:MAG: hypothetical protein AABW59_04230 [archaeon]